ncbi:MAG: hypothetical protein IIX28_00540 [Clostridia bacterium]|nr:hypothetical protein [Clostridia bacterium]
MKELWQKLRARMGVLSDRTVRILIGVGLCGILLIALTECLPTRRSKDAAALPTATAAQVETAMEQRITHLLTVVSGVGDCRVMVTLESDARAVYAADTSVTANATSENYLTVDTDNGPIGLRLTTLQPTVKGVVVACDGGGDPSVREQVADVVSTAFHISRRRVCVVKQQ